MSPVPHIRAVWRGGGARVPTTGGAPPRDGEARPRGTHETRVAARGTRHKDTAVDPGEQDGVHLHVKRGTWWSMTLKQALCHK